MLCPQCGTKFSSVKETRTRKQGLVRLRECFNGHRFRTVEVLLVPEPKKEVKRDEAGRFQKGEPTPRGLVADVSAIRDMEPQ